MALDVKGECCSEGEERPGGVSFILLQGAPSGALPGHGDAEEEVLRSVSACAAQSPARACAGATLQGKDALPPVPSPPSGIRSLIP